MKSGIRTSEFWFATITAVAVAVFGLLVGYGLLTSEQSELWMALIIAIVPAALAAISYGYGKSRATVKESEAWIIERRQEEEKHKE